MKFAWLRKGIIYGLRWGSTIQNGCAGGVLCCDVRIFFNWKCFLLLTVVTLLLLVGTVVVYYCTTLTTQCTQSCYARRNGDTANWQYQHDTRHEKPEIVYFMWLLFYCYGHHLLRIYICFRAKEQRNTAAREEMSLK